MSRIRGLRVGARLLRRGLRSEDGSVTVEVVLWVPIFALLLAFVTDAALLYSNISSMQHVARDAARRVAMNEITTTEAEERVETAETFGGVRYLASAAVVDDDDVIVEVSASAAEAAMFGIFRPVTGDTLRTMVAMRQEPDL